MEDRTVGGRCGRLEEDCSGGGNDGDGIITGEEVEALEEPKGAGKAGESMSVEKAEDV